MKFIGIAAGGGAMLVGLVFFLQGIGILPGSSMSGQGEWAIIGALLVLGGLGLIVWSHRRGLPPRK
jgi:hypothetical protein